MIPKCTTLDQANKDIMFRPCFRDAVGWSRRFCGFILRAPVSLINKHYFYLLFKAPELSKNVKNTRSNIVYLKVLFLFVVAVPLILK